MMKKLGLAVAALAVSIGFASMFNVQASQSEAGGNEPRGDFTLEQARNFSEFPVFYAGSKAQGFPLVAVLRRDDVRSQSPYPAKYVSFIYGDCHAVGDTGCAPPIEIQTWPACVRHLGLYGSPLGPTPERTTIRGVPAAFFEGGRRLEIHTGTSMVVVFARTRAEVLSVADSLRGTNVSVTTGTDLPFPAHGAVSGKLKCDG